jgi:MFS family permease
MKTPAANHILTPQTSTTQNTQSPLRAWLIWGISALFLLFQFFMQLSAAVILPGVEKSFHTNDLWGSLILSSYYYVYVIAQAPAGNMVDRWGPRYLLASGALIIAFGCWIFATTTSIPLAMLARTLMGGGAAFAFVSCINLIKHWFPKEKFSLLVSITETFGMLGAIIGNLVLAQMVKNFGWQPCIKFTLIIACLFSILLWSIIRDKPNAPSTKLTKRPSLDFFPQLKIISKDRLVWLNSLYSGMVFGVISLFVALWGVKFFQQIRHIPLLEATALTNCVFIGCAAGCPVLGYLDAKTTLRKSIMWTFPLLGALLISLILINPTLPKGVLIILLSLFGVSLSSYMLNFVIANQIASDHNQGINMGFINMISVGTAPLLQPLIGFLLDLQNNTGSHENNVFTLSQYQSALWVIPVMLIIASIIGRHLPGSLNTAKHTPHSHQSEDGFN